MKKNKRKKNNIYILLFFILLFFFLLNNSLRYLDLDLGWHLRVGKEILENKEVPHLETYLYTIPNTRWVDHEWLSNLGLYFIFEHFGYFILNIVFVIPPILSIFLLLIITKKFFLKKDSLILAFFLLLLGVLAMAPHLGIRIQEFTLLFLTILLFFILNYDYQKNKKYLYFLIPLFFLWVNLHGGFLIGFAVFGYYIFCKILFFIFKKEGSLKEIIFLIFILIFSFLITFITPYGVELYSFLLSYRDTYYMTHISEWLPAFSYPIIYYQLFYNAFYATILILILREYREYKKRSNSKSWYLSLSFIFFILALKSRRHFPLFFIVSFPLILEFIFIDIKLNLKWEKFIQKNILINSFFIGSIILVIFYFIFSIKIINNPFNNSVFCQEAPCSALRFMKNNEEIKNSVFLNNYNWGGYLDWTWPKKKLFIDGRLPMMEINGHSFLEEYNLFFNKDELENKIEEYKISSVLLAKTKEVHFNWFEKIFLGLKEEDFNRENYLDKYLKESLEWKLIYEDKISKVYLKI